MCHMETIALEQILKYLIDLDRVQHSFLFFLFSNYVQHKCLSKSKTQEEKTLDNQADEQYQRVGLDLS